MDILSGLLMYLSNLYLNPMLYVGIILIILQYKRQISFERKLFSSRIHSLPIEVIKSLFYGLIGGLFASIIMILLGVVFDPTYIWIIWIITTILILFHVRFLCLSYSIGILGFFAGLFQQFQEPISSFINNYLDHIWVDKIFGLLANINIPSLIVIVAVLHFIEAILIKINGKKQATPLFIESKRGKLIGGYHIQSFWLMPIFFMVSTGGSNQDMLFTLAWWPLIFNNIAIIPVPVMIGYSDLTTVFTPEEKANRSFVSLLIYSILLLGMAYIAIYIEPFQIFAALFAILGHEGVRILGRRKENKLPPKYVHSKDGLMVLAVLPGSLAEQMGVQTGEIIKKVNGMLVNNKQELYDALRLNSTFVKLEVINLKGHSKFAQHSIYTGEHHQLGIILAPDENAPYYIELENMNLFKLLKQKVNRISRGA